MIQSFFDMLDHWQALVGGEIAILAAVLTVWGIRWQARDDRNRKLRASRAMMPAALSLVSDYVQATVTWLIETRVPLGKLEGGLEINDMDVPGWPPEPDAKVFEILKDCIEHAEDAPAKAIAELLSGMQVFRSRVAGIGYRLINRATYRGGRVLMLREVDQYMVDAAKLRARTDLLFSFARMETQVAPHVLDFKAVTTAFKALELNEYQEPNVWNDLTAPYVGKIEIPDASTIRRE